MRFLTFAAALLFLGVATKAPAEDLPQEILEKLSGRWAIESGINQGVEIPASRLEGNYTIITGKTIISYDREEKETYNASYTLNTSTNPVQIDMTAMNNGQQVRALGIIKFDWQNDDGHNSFTLAYSLNPNERPKGFDPIVGDKTMLLNMKKASPTTSTSR